MGRLKLAAATGSCKMVLGHTKLEGCPRKYKSHSVLYRERSGHLSASSLNRKVRVKSVNTFPSVLLLFRPRLLHLYNDSIEFYSSGGSCSFPTTNNETTFVRISPQNHNYSEDTCFTNRCCDSHFSFLIPNTKFRYKDARSQASFDSGDSHTCDHPSKHVTWEPPF